MKIFKKIGLVLSALVLGFTLFTYSHQGSARAASTAKGGDACTSGADCVAGLCATDGGDCQNNPSTAPQTCESASGGFSLAWALCPVLNGANALGAAFTKAFESELNFRISDLTSASPKGEKNLETSWSLIRDLASAALVIVMLIMVISQAFGGGPFEAYTVRKMLPRLVAAVILIQISWVLMGWIVNTFADLGDGIRGIMYSPFPLKPNGGSYLDDFGYLLHNAGISGAAAGVFNWVTLITAIGITAAFALPTVLGFCFVGLVSFGVGLAVLVFRKIIIIMAIVFAPLALLAWLLPGTETYFKKWREAFIKALMMFPIAMGLIAAGRIFAYVAGNTGSGTFMNFFIVLIGFFGPLFLLPKTFKWGGEAMQAVGSNAFKLAEKGLIGKEAKPMKYFQNRQQDYNNRNLARSQLRVANEEGFNPRKISSYYHTPLDKFRSHQWDPLLAGETNRSSKRSKVMQYKEAGHKVEEEEQNLADREASFEERRLDQSQYNHDALWQDKADGRLKNYEENEDSVRLDELGTDDMEDYGNYSSELFADWQSRHPGGTREEFNSRGRISYAERDFYRWKRNNPGGTYAQFKNDKNAFGYKDYEGKIVDVHEPEDKFERNAALNMLSKFGGPNHPMLVRYLYQELGAGGEREKSAREWMQDHSDFILKVYPQLLKGLSSTATQPSFVGMHAIGYRDQTSRLMYNIDNPRSAADRQNAQRAFRQQISNLVSNMSNPAEKNGIETDIRVLMKALADGDASTIGRINSEIGRMTYEGGIRDRQTGGAHPPEISRSAAVLEALRPGAFGQDDLLAQISSMLDRNGGYRTGGGDGEGDGTLVVPRGGGSGRGPFTGRVTPDDYGPAGPGERHYAPSMEAAIDRASPPPTPPRATATPSADSPASAHESPSSTDAVTAPAAMSESSGGSYEPTTTTPVSRVTERIIRETSPTFVMQTTPNSVQTPNNSQAQTVYTRPDPNYSPSPTTSPGLDQRTGEELDYQLRRVYRELKNIGTRNREQQQQFEQLQQQHPDWDNEDQNT